MQSLDDKLDIIRREARRNQDIQDLINCELDKLLKMIATTNKISEKIKDRR